MKFTVILLAIFFLNACSTHSINLRPSDLSSEKKIGVFVKRCKGLVGYLGSVTSIMASITGSRFAIRKKAESVAKNELEKQILIALSEVFKGTIEKGNYKHLRQGKYDLKITTWACPGITVLKKNFKLKYKSNIVLIIKARRYFDSALVWEVEEIYSGTSYSEDLEYSVMDSIAWALNNSTNKAIEAIK